MLKKRIKAAPKYPNEFEDEKKRKINPNLSKIDQLSKNYFFYQLFFESDFRSKLIWKSIEIDQNWFQSLKKLASLIAPTIMKSSLQKKLF